MAGRLMLKRRNWGWLTANQKTATTNSQNQMRFILFSTSKTQGDQESHVCAALECSRINAQVLLHLRIE